MQYLQVENLTVKFGGLIAVNNVSFQIAEGQIFSLIGPNGAGKTTLFNAICGFQKKTAGKVLFCGSDISNLKPDEIAKKGIVRTFQHTTIFSGVMVKDAVLTGTIKNSRSSIWDILTRNKNFKNNEKELLELVLEILDFTKLDSVANEYGKNMPYGIQRIIEIAIALAARPKMLLLDEPAAGLNSAEKESLAMLIKRIRDRGITIFLVEHDMPLVMNISDLILAINYGEKIAEGQPEEVSTNPEVIKAYLGGAANA